MRSKKLLSQDMALLRQNQAKLVFMVIILCFCCSFLTIFYILSTHNLKCNCPADGASTSPGKPQAQVQEPGAGGGHKLCLLVPFRDRFEELLEFAPYIHKFLSQQNVEHKIYVMNQVDGYR